MVRVMWLAAVIACSSAPPPPAAPPPPPRVVVVDAGPPPDAPPLDRDLPRLIDRSLAMFHAIAEAFAAAGEDCAAASSRMRELATQYRDVVVANAKVLHDGRAAELRAALSPHDAAFDHAAQAIMQSPTMARCAADTDFVKALNELLTPP